MVEYRLHKSNCPDHGAEWFVYLVHIPRWTKLVHRLYYGFLRLLGNPQTCVREKDNGLITPNFWGVLFSILVLPSNIQERIFDFQFWLSTNRISNLPFDWEQDLGIWIPISEEAAAVFDPAWVADEVAGETFRNIDGPSDIDW